MSITKDRGKIVIECDQCHDTLETETDDFNEAMNMRRDESWLAEKKGNEWLNFCSEACRKEHRSGKKRKVIVV